MKAHELRRKYIDFFVNNYAHAEIKGASVIPENDPTVLFTTAGMHPLIPFLSGEPHPAGKRLVDVQKCIRTGDIEEVGDNSHLTFFEMLGNWSLGDYFKELAINMSFKFLTSSREEGGLGIGLDRLAVTCFAGDEDAPKDMEAYEIWRGLGIKEERIAFLGKEDNWWGPAGQTGPCGPDTEMFYWTGEMPAPAKFDPEDDRWLEIWNDVFMQYDKQADGTFKKLEKQNVDTGMGLERVVSVLNNFNSPFESSLFKEAIDMIRTLAGYSTPDEAKTKSERIVADHLRTATMIVGDPFGVTPSNTDQGYVLRRLIRRAICHGKKLGIEGNFINKIAAIYIKLYGDFYTELQDNKEKILDELAKEEARFTKTLDKAMQLLDREMCMRDKAEKVRSFDETFFFEMFATHGFPIEMTIEVLEENGWITTQADKDYVKKSFEKHFEEHQKLSRAGAEQKFAGGLADHSYETTQLHTATHLLHQALRTVLGDHVEQKGSNITKERLRFDFNFERKMTDEEKKEVEELVNAQINKDLPVSFKEMTIQEAKDTGAIGIFESKYGNKVKVYSMGQGSERFSYEICGGPHVEHLGELQSFKIVSEKSSSSGIRRIKAVVGK
jgi:alanyl-tRNA synthetase